MTENLNIILTTIKNNHGEKNGLVVESLFLSAFEIFGTRLDVFKRFAPLLSLSSFFKFPEIEHSGPYSHLYSHKGFFHLEVNILEVSSSHCV